MSVTGIPTKAKALIFTGNRLVFEPIDKYSCYFRIERRALALKCVGKTQVMLKRMAHLRDFIGRRQLPVGVNVACDQSSILGTHDPVVSASQGIGGNFHTRPRRRDI